MTSLGGRKAFLPSSSTECFFLPLHGLKGCSESEDGTKGAEGGAAEVSLEEALMRLAEFLSLQLGAEESCGTPPDLGKVSITVSSSYSFPLALCSSHSQSFYFDSYFLHSLVRFPHC